MIKQRARPIEILLVEDNPGDIELTKEAFNDSKISNNISVVMDGEQALDYLRRENGYKDSITPDIILLDLNLPKKDGAKVLEEIKCDPNLKRIPVVIMTSSKAERDVIKTYNLHVNSYLVKPVSLSKFADIVEAIDNFWFSIVILPSDVEIEKVE